MTADERRTLREAVDARRREVENVPPEAVPMTRSGQRAGWLHGTEAGYRHGRCRCAACRVAANAARQGRRRRPNVSAHGTHSGYSSGCRCDACRSGHSVYDRTRKRGKRGKAAA